MREADLVFQTIFHQSPVSTQIFTPDGETLMVNTAWEKLWNAKFSQVKLYNVLKDKQLVKSGIMPYIKRAFKGEAVDIPPIRYDPSQTVKLKGLVPYRWLSARMYPIKNTKGKISHVVLQHEDITERKEIEEIKYRLAAIVESSSDVIVSKTLDGVITSWNKSAQKLFGYTEREAVGKNIKLIIPSSLHNEEKKIMQLLRKGRRIEHFETVRVAKDGRRVVVSLSISPIKDDGGNVIGAAKIARNITDQKKAEAALRESEEKYRLVLENSHDLINLLDLQGNFLYVNPSHERILGYSSGELMKHNAFELIHPNDIPHVQNEFQRALREGFGSAQLRYLHKDGYYLTLEGNGSRVLNEKGEPSFVVAIFRDITENKKREEELRISEERLRIALNAGAIGVWDWDIQQDVLIWTDNVYTIHGVSPDSFEVTLATYRELIHPDDREKIEEAIQKSLTRKEPYHLDLRIVTPDGDMRWVNTSAVVLFDENDKPYRMLGATSDITEQKQLEQDKSDFLSMASHELKTPLTSMKMFISLLHKQLEGEREQSYYFITRIQDQADRLSELTNDLLDVSRIETGKLLLRKETFNLYDLVTDTVEAIQSTTTHHSILAQGSRRVVVRADRYRIYQVLVNFLTNAIKYSPKSKRIIVNLTKDKNKAIVSVKDFGIGIAKRQQDKVFDRLYQVTDPEEKTYPGLGLGLYITKEIVERHHGKVWLQSVKGRGSTFYFNLPLAKK